MLTRAQLRHRADHILWLLLPLRFSILLTLQSTRNAPTPIGCSRSPFVPLAPRHPTYDIYAHVCTPFTRERGHISCECVVFYTYVLCKSSPVECHSTFNVRRCCCLFCCFYVRLFSYIVVLVIIIIIIILFNVVTVIVGRSTEILGGCGDIDALVVPAQKKPMKPHSHL